MSNSPPGLRYILFHHQTTTCKVRWRWTIGCVISSFITKPQLTQDYILPALGCVISSFITKPQPEPCTLLYMLVALYPLSSPNHNHVEQHFTHEHVALYPLSSPNHNPCLNSLLLLLVALYPLSSPNHNDVDATDMHNLLRYILFHHQTTTLATVIPRSN